jgi:ubiquinone/menaquinone biosynthesis C-methylase UbiE
VKAQLQKRVQRYGWDRAASFYEDSWKEQLSPAQELLLKRAELRPKQRVLDVAAGTGLVTFPAAEMVGNDGHVAATDLSDKMIEYLREEAVRRDLSQISAKQEDAESISSDDDTFDAVLCSLGLMYVPEPQKSVQEMTRVVRSDGRVVASVWGRRSQCGWAGIFTVVDERVDTDVCPLFFSLGTGESLKTVFDVAGLQNIVEDRIRTTLSYPTAEAASMAAFAGGPVALAYSRFDEQTRVEAQAEYLETIEAYRNGSGYSIPGEFVVVSGVKP